MVLFPKKLFGQIYICQFPKFHHTVTGLFVTPKNIKDKKYLLCKLVAANIRLGD